MRPNLGIFPFAAKRTRSAKEGVYASLLQWQLWVYVWLHFLIHPGNARVPFSLPQLAPLDYLQGARVL